MFNRNRRRGLKQAIDQVTDYEMRDHHANVSMRQDRVVQLEAELAETRAELVLFERKLEGEVGNLKHTLSVLKAKLEDARRTAQWKAQWGDRAETDNVPEDVVEQFQKTWRPRGGPKPPVVEKPLNDEGKAQLKAAFRALAKKFHPDLVMDPGEKVHREEIMAEVNQAYAASDLGALEKLMEQPEVVSGQPPRTREGEIRHLREEIRRLDAVISGLEKTLSDLTNSATLKLMLDVSMARNEGRDLLAEMAEDYKLEISRVESELALLQ
jgi:hypothetical protein